MDFVAIDNRDQMRELDDSECLNVSGGFGLPGLVIGTIGGAANGYLNGGGLSGAARGALFGAAIGVTGGLAAATTGFVRLGWGARSVGLTVAAGGIDRRIVTSQR